MPDTPLDMLVVRDMPDGTFAVADAPGRPHRAGWVQEPRRGPEVYRGLLFGPWHHRAACSKEALISFVVCPAQCGRNRSLRARGIVELVVPAIGVGLQDAE